MTRSVLFQSLRRGVRTLCSRRAYMVCLIIVPVAFTLFFINMMDEGVATKVPSGIVDLDHSQL